MYMSDVAVWGSATLLRDILDPHLEFAGQHIETRESIAEEDCNVVNLSFIKNVLDEIYICCIDNLCLIKSITSFDDRS